MLPLPLCVLVNRLLPIRCEPLVARGAIAMPPILRAATRQDGTSWPLPAQRGGGSAIENAVASVQLPVLAMHGMRDA